MLNIEFLQKINQASLLKLLGIPYPQLPCYISCAKCKQHSLVYFDPIIKSPVIWCKNCGSFDWLEYLNILYYNNSLNADELLPFLFSNNVIIDDVTNDDFSKFTKLLKNINEEKYLFKKINIFSESPGYIRLAASYLSLFGFETTHAIDCIKGIINVIPKEYLSNQYTFFDDFLIVMPAWLSTYTPAGITVLTKSGNTYFIPTRYNNFKLGYTNWLETDSTYLTKDISEFISLHLWSIKKDARKAPLGLFSYSGIGYANIFPDVIKYNKETNILTQNISLIDINLARLTNSTIIEVNKKFNTKIPVKKQKTWREAFVKLIQNDTNIDVMTCLLSLNLDDSELNIIANDLNLTYPKLTYFSYGSELLGIKNNTIINNKKCICNFVPEIKLISNDKYIINVKTYEGKDETFLMDSLEFYERLFFSVKERFKSSKLFCSPKYTKNLPYISLALSKPEILNSIPNVTFDRIRLPRHTINSEGVISDAFYIPSIVDFDFVINKPLPLELLTTHFGLFYYLILQNIIGHEVTFIPVDEESRLNTIKMLNIIDGKIIKYNKYILKSVLQEFKLLKNNMHWPIAIEPIDLSDKKIHTGSFSGAIILNENLKHRVWKDRVCLYKLPFFDDMSVDEIKSSFGSGLAYYFGRRDKFHSCRSDVLQVMLHNAYYANLPYGKVEEMTRRLLKLHFLIQPHPKGVEAVKKLLIERGAQQLSSEETMLKLYDKFIQKYL